MSKAVYAVGGLGLGACLVLSMMMQHLLKVRTEHQRPPVLGALEERFGGHLLGPVAVATYDRDGRLTMVVTLKVVAGPDKRRLGEAAGLLAWRYACAPGLTQPEALVVEIEDETGRSEAVRVSRPPMFSVPPSGGRPPKPSATAKPPATPPPGKAPPAAPTPKD